MTQVTTPWERMDPDARKAELAMLRERAGGRVEVYGPPEPGTVSARGGDLTAIREGDGEVLYVGHLGGIHRAGGRVAARFIPYTGDELK